MALAANPRKNKLSPARERSFSDQRNYGSGLRQGLNFDRPLNSPPPMHPPTHRQKGEVLLQAVCVPRLYFGLTAIQV